MPKVSLRPLSSKIPSYSIYAFDIETTGSDNDFLMGSVVGDNVKKIFWDKKEMIKYITTKRDFYHSSRIFATNLSFDLMALFQKTEWMPKLSILLRGSKIIQAKLQVETHQPKKDTEPIIKKMTFLDTLNYSLFSVEELGKIINLPKMEMPPYILEKRMPTENEKSYIEEYNIRDSEITFRFASFMQDSFNRMGCKMRMTIASTALDLFKRRYLNKKMYQEPKMIMEKQYEGYYGGRAEVFKRGIARDVNYYDFNSLYPSVMRNEYPDVSSSYYREKGYMDFIESYHGISDVDLFCPKTINIPLLPLHMNGKLLFPSGKFSGWYSHIEIRKALEIGYLLLNIREQIYYTHSHYPFKEYVENLYQLRKEKKEAKDRTELIIKLMMNSLYGKFGQKITGHEKIYHIDTLTYDQIRRMSEKGNLSMVGEYIYFVEHNPTHIASHIMPIYALYTTAYGRINLYEAMKNVDVIYVDTDSIVTPDAISVSKEMGELKLEHRIKEGIFIRPKMYGFLTEEGESHIRIKGNSASFDWDYDRFKRFISNPTVQTDRFSTFKTANRKGISFNSILQIEKNFELEDDKRIWEGSFNPLSAQGSSPLVI